MATGGSIESVSLSGRVFGVASDADSNRKLGGYMNEVQANGNQTTRQVKKFEPWMVDGLQLSIDDTRGDQEFLQDLANRTSEYTCLVTYASGESYQGEGQITGDLQVSSMNTTGTVVLMGSGTLNKQ